jgi:hypothetical protein
LADEAVPPASDGVGVTGEFFGDLEVGGLVGLGTAKDEASAEGEALGSEARVSDLGEAVAFVRGKGDASRFAGHEGASLLLGKPNRDDSQ